MRPDGSHRRNLTNTPEFSELAVRFSPDARKILFRRAFAEEGIQVQVVLHGKSLPLIQKTNLEMHDRLKTLAEACAKIGFQVHAGSPMKVEYRNIRIKN